MASLLQLPLGGLVLLSVLSAPAQAQVNSDASPFVMPYGLNGSVGPDGPWWFIAQPIDYPSQYVQMLPSVSELSLVVNSDACDDSTTCPLPLPVMWQRSGAWLVTRGNETISDDVDAGRWDEDLKALLGLQGRGRYFADRMSMEKDGDTSYLDETGMMLSDSYEATFDGGASYTLNTGFFSLYGADNTVSWSSENGSDVTFNRTLPFAYRNGAIPSNSYGLHVGSVYPNVSGSLVLGGYDSSRAISDPIASDDGTFTLNTVTLGSVGGAYMYYGEPDFSESMLSTPGLDVKINPGAPYIYLPKETCDSIAEFLGTEYSSDYNLYLWDTSDTAFRDIVTTLHYLSFGFASSNNRTQEINVPFALLNLTLESPLTSEPTYYFPCSPLKNGQTPTLGRAFLQGAFLAQNWQTERSFLSQAPGPDFEPQQIITISGGATHLDPATNPPSWSSTWTSTIPPWDDSMDPSNVEDGGGLSAGTIAGIVVGIVAFLAIVTGIAVWFFRRQRRRQSWTKPGASINNPAELSDVGAARNAHQTGNTYAYYKPDQRPAEIYEAEARPPAQELDANQQIGELPAADGPRYVWKR